MDNGIFYKSTAGEERFVAYWLFKKHIPNTTNEIVSKYSS